MTDKTQDIIFPTQVTIVKDKLLSPDARHYVYNVVLTVIPLLLIWGKITHDTAQYILNVVAAVLGLGTAGLATLNKPQSVQITVDPHSALSAKETGHIEGVKEHGE